MPEWHISDTPTDAELAVLSEGVFRVGRALAANGNARPLACFVRDGGSIIAGGSGRTEFDRLFVQYLWVAEPRRSCGLGSEVLSRLESSARERGCRDALIETLSDRLATLYRRLGYKPIATILRHVGEFTRHIMVKPLAK